MAYGTKYRLAYTDNFSQAVQIDLQQDGYSGGITAVSGAGTPLFINHDTAADFLFEPILGTWVTVRLLATSNFLYNEFFTTDSREWKCEITIAGAVVYTGFAAPGQFQQPYRAAPYHIEVIFTDQLGALRSLPYPTQMTTYENQLDINIIAGCLSQTGLNLNMREGINLYEENMDQTTADSPLDQCYRDMEAFINDDGTMVDCYTILRDILLNYQAVIRQVNNEWHIWRPSEQVATYQRRLWTWSTEAQGWTYTSTASFDPRLTTTSATEAMATKVRIMNNGDMMILDPWKQYVLNRKLKRRVSILLNPDWSSWIDENTPKNWTQKDSPVITRHYDGMKLKADTGAPYGSLKQVVPLLFTTPMTDSMIRLDFNVNLYVPAGEEAQFWMDIKMAGTSTYYYKWDLFGMTVVGGLAAVPVISIDNSAGAKDYNGSHTIKAVAAQTVDIGDAELSIEIYLVGDSTDAFCILEPLNFVVTNYAFWGDPPENIEELVTVNADNNYIPSDIEILSGYLPEQITYDVRGNLYAPTKNLYLVYGSGTYLDAARTTLLDAWGDSGVLLSEILKEIVNNQYEQPTELLTVNIYSKLIKGDSTLIEADHSSNKYFINRTQYDQKHGICRVEITQLYTVGYLLEETGDYLLQEDGSSLLIL